MKTRLLERRARALRLRLLTLLATAGAAGACAAAELPYNPYDLSAEQIARVATICQTVMGLQPGAALTDNLWPGDPDPAGSTNEFRGCTATLSSSLQRSAAARATARAEQDCRSQGLGCREQLSCAELGLDPEEAEFATCVQGLARVVAARFMEDGYRNGS